MKLEIINTSPEFVARFWGFAEEKSFKWNITEKMLSFSTCGGGKRADPDECVRGYVKEC
jgi:hypothetical protein